MTSGYPASGNSADAASKRSPTATERASPPLDNAMEYRTFRPARKQPRNSQESRIFVGVSDVAVYGLGEMGADIARCLAARGLVPNVYDPAGSPVLKADGVRPGLSVAQVAAESRVHIVVVKQLLDLEELLFAADGLCSAAPADSLIILHTTVTPQVAMALRAKAAEHGHTMLDAALSRRDGMIKDGSLSLLVGAEPAELQRAKSVLDSYADNVVHMGPPGSGMIAKLCNNWLLYANRHAALQALSAGRQLGLDVNVLLGALSSSSGSSWALAHYSDFDEAILDGRDASPTMLDRTYAELCLVRAMVSPAGTLPTTLVDTIAWVETIRGQQPKEVDSAS